MTPITVELVLEKLANLPVGQISSAFQAGRQEPSWADRVKSGDYEGVKQDALKQNEELAKKMRENEFARVNTALKGLRAPKDPPPPKTGQPSGIDGILSNLLSRGQ